MVSGQTCLLDPRMHDISVVCQLDMRILLHMLYEEMYYRLCRIILNLLLQCKADINVSDNDGVTPLSTACERNRKDIVEFLLSKEASVNQSDKDGGTS
jgi:ankyrin repeat protein